LRKGSPGFGLFCVKIPAEDPLPFINPQISHIHEHPGKFALQVLKAFRANQGLLLAGAVGVLHAAFDGAS
jgi:hypothetical protein